ncbi:hypothetical protein [Flavivirga algicola]|uniref:Uncharacterized protein n=1 Tax=Flavivirga algicola TaxID=2729136 RepID=A0ABX1S1Z8_9FLAO|nr:hypothetical protein [Flavivirga algicola]NMH89243.1 hypothetical protein [Flavivirga algicola]
MITEKLSYELAEVSCEKKGCNETFDILIYSIHTVVKNPFGDTELSSIGQKNVLKTGKIDASLAIKCICGHSQKVYLREKQRGLQKSYNP